MTPDDSETPGKPGRLDLARISEREAATEIARQIAAFKQAHNLPEARAIYESPTAPTGDDETARDEKAAGARSSSSDAPPSPESGPESGPVPGSAYSDFREHDAPRAESGAAHFADGPDESPRHAAADFDPRDTPDLRPLDRPHARGPARGGVLGPPESAYPPMHPLLQSGPHLLGERRQPPSQFAPNIRTAAGQRRDDSSYDAPPADLDARWTMRQSQHEGQHESRHEGQHSWDYPRMPTPAQRQAPMTSSEQPSLDADDARPKLDALDRPRLTMPPDLRRAPLLEEELSVRPRRERPRRAAFAKFAVLAAILVAGSWGGLRLVETVGETGQPAILTVLGDALDEAAADYRRQIAQEQPDAPRLPQPPALTDAAAPPPKEQDLALATAPSRQAAEPAQTAPTNTPAAAPDGAAEQSAATDAAAIQQPSAAPQTAPAPASEKPDPAQLAAAPDAPPAGSPLATVRPLLKPGGESAPAQGEAERAAAPQAVAPIAASGATLAPAPVHLPESEMFTPTPKPFIPSAHLRAPAAKPFVPTPRPFVPTARPFQPKPKPFVPASQSAQ